MDLNVASELMKIAKLIMGAGYFVNFQDGSFALKVGKWGKLFGDKQGQDAYTVYVFRSLKAVEKLLTPEKIAAYVAEANADSKYKLEENKDRVLSSIATSVDFRLSYKQVNIAHSFIKQPIFKELVVDEVLELKSKAELYELLVGDYKMHASQFTEMFGEYEHKDSDRIQNIIHKKWSIALDSKANQDSTVAIKMLDEAESYLNSKGFGRLAYGKVVFSDHLGSANKLADYETGTDILRLAGNKRVDHNRFVRSIVHELGHRNWYKFLSKVKRDVVYTKYLEMNSNVPKLELNEGDIIEDKDRNEQFVIKRWDWPNYVATMLSSPNSRSQKSIGKDFKIPAKIIPMGWSIVKSDTYTVGDHSAGTYFPTAYAYTNKEEMYAELFATWLIKGLQEPAKSWFEFINS